MSLFCHSWISSAFSKFLLHGLSSCFPIIYWYSLGFLIRVLFSLYYPWKPHPNARLSTPCLTLELLIHWSNVYSTSRLFVCTQCVPSSFPVNNLFLLNLLSWLCNPSQMVVIYDSWPVFKFMSWACLLHGIGPTVFWISMCCVTYYGVRSYSVYVCLHCFPQLLEHSRFLVSFLNGWIQGSVNASSLKQRYLEAKVVILFFRP